MPEAHSGHPVLVVDDDTLVLRALEATLKRHFDVHCAPGGEAALELLARHPEIGVAIIDQRMPGMSGPELIRRTVDPYPHLVRIILTGYQDIDSLKAAINNGGAYRYLEKPCPNDELLAAVRGAFALHRRLVEGVKKPVELAAANDMLRESNQRLQLENLQLRLDAHSRYQLDGELVGSSPALRQVLADADRVAASDTTVLILGETGTGKELLARYLHNRSGHRAGAFRAQNCGAVAEPLMEDMLFGHVPGAYTGARGLKKGLFEIADGGTLFLDEIGECPATLQARLLRVVEERTVHRLGDDENAIPLDVRLITATNRDLRREVDAGRFRQDLYYRLNVFCLHMPPLRERRGDIAELARHFVACLNERARATSGKFVAGVTPEALAVLEGYDFPGNVRELANIIERSWLYADDESEITPDLLLSGLQAIPRSTPNGAPLAAVNAATAVPLRDALLAFKADFIARTLADNGWNVAATARQLGITRTRLYDEMKECSLQRPD